ncbi:hypothetical protein CCR75_005485 [Bremia lactucae]|uniref:Interferon-related developmental regulator N-terminal domain-containing protein n=1 Tax=Bremia lactucae TaxID=4779 RepID=A0A976FQ43_BRELC|nr:hypothetical protein CCR75_005485 [Bremia lactucae]
MGKKRNGMIKAGRHTRHGKRDDEESMSLESVKTLASNDSEFDGILRKGGEDRIDDVIEELNEERTTTRVAALAKLKSKLLQYLAPEDLSESFVANVLGCLRKPSEDEAVLGSQILAITAIILGNDEERFYQRSKNVLMPLIKASRKAKVMVPSCVTSNNNEQTISALGLICFICSVETENTYDVLETLETFFDPKIAGDICNAALESWGLVASNLEDTMLVSDTFTGRLVPKFIALLDHKEIEVRSAAGENVAFLHEISQNYGVTLPYDGEVIDRFLELSKENSKRNSKKDRKVQRVAFRDIYLSLANGEIPHISFSVKGEVLEISSWKLVKQFEAVKNCLQTGLQEHIKYNKRLRALLDLPDTLEDRKLGGSEYLDKKSASRKQRSIGIKGDRKQKQHMQNVFYES